MKISIFYEIMKNAKRNPLLMRKLKILLGFGFVGIFLFTGVAAWGTYRLVEFATSQSPSVSISEHLRDLAVKSRAVTEAHCLNKAQSLLNVGAWIERPVLDNLRNLKSICLDTNKPICEGIECDLLKRSLRTAEQGELI